MGPDQQKAFSLAELLVVIVVLGIVLSIATPSFNAFIQHNRQTTHVNQMIDLLNYARAEAVTRRTMVSLCSGDASCGSATYWQHQILIFNDTNRNGQFDIGDALLRIALLDENHRWHWSNFRNQKHMSYKPDGTTHSLNGTFTLCQNAQPMRSITLNTSGRARLGAANAERCSQ